MRAIVMRCSFSFEAHISDTGHQPIHYYSPQQPGLGLSSIGGVVSSLTLYLANSTLRDQEAKYWPRVLLAGSP